VFVQITKSSRQHGKTYLSYLVRESFRTPSGPRSRTVCNITDLPPATRDLIAAYEAMVPSIRFTHAEGNSDAHLMATLLGSSVTVPVAAGRLGLGTWQGIFFVELDGPRLRKVFISRI